MYTSKKQSGQNLRLAGLFILLVFGLLAVSILIKSIFILRDSKFDDVHRFNVAFSENNKTEVVSFSPSNKSIYMLGVDKKIDKNNPSKFLEVPIDGLINTSTDVSGKNLSSVFLKSLFTLGNSSQKLTSIDLLRLMLFTRSVSSDSVYETDLSDNLNDAQKSTLISLSFTDPTIYQENKSIEIINATDVFGLGARLATLIQNIGGNVVLVSSADTLQKNSEITYSGSDSYTIKKLSSFLGFPIKKSEQKGISDVIIIIGEDGKKADF